MLFLKYLVSCKTCTIY